MDTRAAVVKMADKEYSLVPKQLDLGKKANVWILSTARLHAARTKTWTECVKGLPRMQKCR